MSQAELRALLTDSLALWGVPARVDPHGDDIEITVAADSFLVCRAPSDMRPVRWLLMAPERALAGRPPRALPSVVALLTALRNAVGAEGGQRIVVGPRRSPDGASAP